MQCITLESAAVAVNRSKLEFTAAVRGITVVALSLCYAHRLLVVIHTCVGRRGGVVIRGNLICSRLNRGQALHVTWNYFEITFKIISVFYFTRSHV